MPDPSPAIPAAPAAGRLVGAPAPRPPVPPVIAPMQAPTAFRSRLDLFAGQPTVGELMALCEENYGALARLVPALTDLCGHFTSRRPGQVDLLLEIVDQAPYTTTLRLTHRFALSAAGVAAATEPDALLRAYHDAGQVEVLQLRQTVLPLFTHYGAPALIAKWRANLFLAKWLGYCVREGHRFPPELTPPTAPSTDEALLTGER